MTRPELPSRYVRDAAQSDLMTGARFGRIELVEAALSKGASPKMRSKGQGYTALMLAARSGRVDIAKLLLPLSDAKQSDTSGMNALLCALREGDADMSRLLLPACDPLAQDKAGRGALLCAAISGNDDCVALALALPSIKGMDQETEEGHTALIAACLLGRADAIARLLAHGAEPNRKDRHGSTPLHLAAMSGSIRSVLALLGRADLDAKDRQGQTADGLADERGCYEISQAILTRRGVELEKTAIDKVAASAPSKAANPRI